MMGPSTQEVKIKQPSTEVLQAREVAHDRREQAHRVFTERLTAVESDVKDAILALYDLVQADQQSCRCSCPVGQ